MIGGPSNRMIHQKQAERRLAAIMVADIVGYSVLMEKAEEHTADRMARCQQLIREKAAAVGGRVFNTAGDAWLAEFGSPINALRCAAEIRHALAGNEGAEGATRCDCASAFISPTSSSEAMISLATG